jgi:hypothetical protein
MSCLPGMDCWDAYYHPPGVPNSNTVLYVGPNLPNSGVNTNNSLTIALEKIDEKLSVSAADVLAAIANDPILKAQLCTIINQC